MITVGTILAGGKSRRMGTDKALLHLNGSSLIQKAASTLREVFDTTIIISDRAADYEFLQLPIYPDVFNDCGPLGGIHSAMEHANANAVFILSCDMPFVSAELVRYVCGFEGEGQVKSPVWNHRLHPLCAWYSCSLKSDITQRLEAGELMVQGLLRDIRSVWVPITSELPFYNENLLANINDPDEYNRFAPPPTSVS